MFGKDPIGMLCDLALSWHDPALRVAMRPQATEEALHRPVRSLEQMPCHNQACNLPGMRLRVPRGQPHRPGKGPGRHDTVSSEPLISREERG